MAALLEATPRGSAGGAGGALRAFEGCRSAAVLIGNREYASAPGSWTRGAFPARWRAGGGSGGGGSCSWSASEPTSLLAISAFEGRPRFFLTGKEPAVAILASRGEDGLASGGAGASSAASACGGMPRSACAARCAAMACASMASSAVSSPISKPRPHQNSNCFLSRLLILADTRVAFCMIAVGSSSARPALTDISSTQSSLQWSVTMPRRPCSKVYSRMPLVSLLPALLLPLRCVSRSAFWNLASSARRK
mmetsp:Transcript_18003/g.46033  ORF Transcript_18003/g.46033 Transcript_18003/m.46033 type:complete len:251 (-) Transcript_18003:181-933(-)